MLNFKNFKLEDYSKVTAYRAQSELKTCELSAGTLFMWRDYYKPSFAVVDDTLIIRKEGEEDGNLTVYFPIGKNVNSALDSINGYCINKNLNLIFAGVEDAFLPVLKEKYNGLIRYESMRAWSDYVYDAQNFREFKGKKYSGQRNHINKFLSLFPESQVKPFTEDDIPRALELLKEYAKEKNINTKLGLRELNYAKEATENFKILGLEGIYVEHNGKLISYSLTEKCGKTQIIHIEKALRAYSGLYPFTANAMAKNTTATYLNREDDAGDIGLRTSKLQYHPIELLNKNFVYVMRPEKRMRSIPTIFVENLVLKPLSVEDATSYHSLNVDDKNNEFWGYDYREDNSSPEGDYFYQTVLEDFNQRKSFTFGIYSEGKLIGESVFYNIKMGGECEVGIRFFPDYQNKGYGTLVLKRVCDFLLLELKMKKIYMKCYKQNVRSDKIINRNGFKLINQTEEMNFYVKQI